MDELFGIAIRISFMYLFALGMLRLAGKSAIYSLSPMDIIAGLILGDLFDNVIWAEIPIANGVVAMSVILLLHTLIAYGRYRSDRLNHLFAGRETAVIEKSHYLEPNLAKERIREDTLAYELRIQGEEDLQEVSQAFLEPCGQLSVFKKPEFKPAQKKDLPKLEELV